MYGITHSPVPPHTTTASDMAPLLSRPFPLLVVLLVLCAMSSLPSRATASSSTHDDPLMLDRFHRWMSAHGRSYPSAAEKLRRFEVYRRNVELIESSNRDAERLGYELGENQFTDLTNEEFTERYTGGAVGSDDDSVITTLVGDIREGRAAVDEGGNLTASPPKQFDWREHGAVTPAKHQGACGCCWAFAAAATVESLNKIKGGKLVDLSVQEIVDCGNNRSPCTSGTPDGALNWIKSKGGLLTAAEYPYVAKQGTCKSTSAAAGNRVGKITGVEKVAWDNEAELALAVLKTPVAVQIDASGAVFQNYKTGVYAGPCSTSQNHVVVVVGYGVTGDGVQYWIVKNSWGQGWGQNGFAFMRRGADGRSGLCGIAGWPVYPVMD